MNITTLVPAYKTKYIGALLTGLKHQTRAPAAVVFSDDSPGGEFTQALMSELYAPLRAGLNLCIAPGPRTGAYANIRHLVERQQERPTELFHVLLDDDVVFPEFYERHLTAHASGAFSCSISRRWTANEAGQPQGSLPIPPAVMNNPSRMVEVNADVAFMTTVAECKNWFGEFSNVVFRHDMSPVLLDPSLDGVSFAGLWDLGAFLAASVRRPICYVQDYLGYFRIGPDQNSAKTYGPMMKSAVLGYAALAMGGHRIGKLSDAQALHCYRTMASVVQVYYGAEQDVAPFLPVLARLAAGDIATQQPFLDAWAAFLQLHRL